MPKKPLQDVVPPPSRPHKMHRRQPRPLDFDEEIKAAQTSPKHFRWQLWSVALLSIVALVFAMSFFFSGATVTVVPKEGTVTVQGEIDFLTTGSTEAQGKLSYEPITIEETATKEILSTGAESAEERASGAIVVYNNYSKASQRLITNTRFETPDGLIYKIQKPVDVPGQHLEGGKLVPGSIEVTVYADEPGEKYNIGLTDFTVPGFKESPRFEGFYARSKSPMIGGFSGTRLTAPEGAVKVAQEELRSSLRETLFARALDRETKDLTFFRGVAAVLFESLPSTEGDGTVIVRERATLYAGLLPLQKLAEELASRTIGGYDRAPVTLEDAAALELSLNEENRQAIARSQAISVQLSGIAHLVWVFDEKKLAEDLAGRSREAVSTILSGYPSIIKADVIIRPFWKRVFPDNPADIVIIQSLSGGK